MNPSIALKFEGNHKVKVFAFWGLVILFCLKAYSFILNAQFWAEDGPIFYKQAWENGISSISSSYAGYHVVTIRIVAYLSTFFSIDYAPTICNLFTLALQILPLYFIFSQRLNKVFVSDVLKYGFALIYLIGPGAREVFLTMTNIQWYLPIWVLLFLFSEPSKNRNVKIVEYVLLLLFSLTGPYAIFIFPIYGGMLLLRKIKLDKIAFAIIVISFALQASSLVCSPSVLLITTVDFSRFLDFFSIKIILSSILGQRILNDLFHEMPSEIVLYFGLLLWVFISIRVLLSKNHFLMTLIALGNLNFVAGYFKVGSQMGWQPESGARYAWVGIFAYCFAYFYFTSTSKNKIEKYFLYLLVLLTVFVAIPGDFNYFNPKSKDWAHNVRSYDLANQGDSVLFETDPNENFNFTIVKKGVNKLTEILPTNNVSAYFSFEVINDSLFTKDGWAFINNHNCDGNEVFVVFKSSKKSFAFKTKPYIRADISAAFKGNYDLAGFNLTASTSKIDSNSYDIGILIYNSNLNSYGLKYLKSDVLVYQAQSNHYIDALTLEKKNLKLRGWAVLKNLSSQHEGISVYAVSKSGSYLIPSQLELRSDVSVAFRGNYDQSGFISNYDVSNLPKGDYIVQIKITQSDWIKKIDTNKKFTVQ